MSVKAEILQIEIPYLHTWVRDLVHGLFQKYSANPHGMHSVDQQTMQIYHLLILQFSRESTRSDCSVTIIMFLFSLILGTLCSGV